MSDIAVLVGEEIHALAASLAFDESVYVALANALLKWSFGASTKAAIGVDRLVDSFRFMGYFLLESKTTRVVPTIDVAYEAAERVQFDLFAASIDPNELEELRMTFEAGLIALVYIMVFQDRLQMITAPRLRFRIYKSYDDLIDCYKAYTTEPGFPMDDIDDMEARKLLQFTNFMIIAVALFPKPRNGDRLRKLVTRIAEHFRQRDYTMGKGKTSFTRRRIAIYQKEANFKPRTYLMFGEDVSKVIENHKSVPSICNAISKLIHKWNPSSPAKPLLERYLGPCVLEMANALRSTESGQQNFAIAWSCALSAGIDISPQALELARAGEIEDQSSNSIGLTELQDLKLAFECALVAVYYALSNTQNISTNAPTLCSYFQCFAELASYYQHLETPDEQRLITSSFTLKGVDELEQRKLLHFANFMRITAKFSKGTESSHLDLLAVALRFGESARGANYNFATKVGDPRIERRVAIFETEMTKSFTMEMLQQSPPAKKKKKNKPNVRSLSGVLEGTCCLGEDLWLLASEHPLRKELPSQEFISQLATIVLKWSFPLPQPCEDYAARFKQCLCDHMSRILSDLKNGNREILSQHKVVALTMGTVIEASTERLLLYRTVQLCLLVGMAYSRDSDMLDLPELYTDYNGVHENYKDYSIEPGYSADGLDEIEKTKLLYFSNTMRVMMLFNHHQISRADLMTVCTLAAEKNTKYCRGGCKSPFTKRRQCIYQLESGTIPILRRLIGDDIGILANDDTMRGPALWRALSTSLQQWTYRNSTIECVRDALLPAIVHMASLLQSKPSAEWNFTIAAEAATHCGVSFSNLSAVTREDVAIVRDSITTSELQSMLESALMCLIYVAIARRDACVNDANATAARRAVEIDTTGNLCIPSVPSQQQSQLQSDAIAAAITVGAPSSSMASRGKRLLLIYDDNHPSVVQYAKGTDKKKMRHFVNYLRIAFALAAVPGTAHVPHGDFILERVNRFLMVARKASIAGTTSTSSTDKRKSDTAMVSNLASLTEPQRCIYDQEREKINSSHILMVVAMEENVFKQWLFERPTEAAQQNSTTDNTITLNRKRGRNVRLWHQYQVDTEPRRWRDLEPEEEPDGGQAVVQMVHPVLSIVPIPIGSLEMANIIINNAPNQAVFDGSSTITYSDLFAPLHQLAHIDHNVVVPATQMALPLATTQMAPPLSTMQPENEFDSTISLLMHMREN